MDKLTQGEMLSHLAIDDKGWLRRNERKKALKDAHHSRRWPSLSQGACCANRLKAESLKPGGLLYPLEVPAMEVVKRHEGFRGWTA